MDVKQFYADLGDWVLLINQKSQQLSPDEYWTFIITSAGELSKKYDEKPLVKKILHAHLDYLEEMAKGEA